MNSNTIDIELKFIHSWKSVIEHYQLCDSFESKRFPIIQEILKHMIDKGYNKVFRAGTSLNKLILSRSENYGLKDYHTKISIEPKYDWDREGGAVIVNFFNEDKITEFESNNLIGSIEFWRLVKKLQTENIG